MTSEIQDFQAIVGRMDRLERQNRRLKVLSVGLLGCSLLVGLGSSALRATGTPRAQTH